MTLQVTGGPSAGRAIRVEPGQIVRIGKSDGADLSLPEDAGLGAVHFTLTCDSQNCHLRALDGTGELRVNGERVLRAILSVGDRITAGATTFSIAADGPATSAAPPAAPAPATAAAAAPAPPASAPGAEMSAESCCRELNLDDDARALAQAGETALQLLDRLSRAEQFPAAARVIAFLLPRPAAVQWGIECLLRVSARELPPAEASALMAAEQWVADPSETHRRAAEQAAEAAEYRGAASWIAMAVFWSGGSIAPVGQADVPPAPQLTAQAVAAGLAMASVHRDPRTGTERYRTFLESGREALRQHGVPVTVSR